MSGRTAGQQDTAGEARAARLAEVDGAVGRTAQQLTRQRPETAGHIERAFDGLRTRLRYAHDSCHEVDADSWTSYVSRLDRGLGELQVEVSRAGEGSAATLPMDDVLFTRGTRLELDGWRLQFDILRSRSEADRGRARAELDELTAAADRALTEYERGRPAADVVSRSAVELAMDEVRNAARAVPPG